jgi:UDP-N-acetylmuramyl tripeptide synthase
VILDERAAIQHALESMAPGEVVLVFTDDCATTLHLLKEHGATPARSVGKLARSGVPQPMNEKRTA